MSELTPSVPPNRPPVQERLEELARLLRTTAHLRPGAQQELADLLVEMAGELAAAPASPQSQHLAESAATLAHALHEEHTGGPLDAAKKRVIEAAARAEAKAPVATGLARQFVDLLAEIGI